MSYLGTDGSNESIASCFTPEADKASAQQLKKVATCTMCNEHAAKYRCPKCLCRTCSLPCVKRHKELDNCDGIRCKTAYVPMSSYNENHMLSDYRLLEEIARCCDNNDRFLKENPSFKTKGMKLQMKKAKSMNIDLRLFPISFTEREGNSTFFNRRSNSFLWHVRWNFHPVGTSLHKRSVPESKTLEEALKTCGVDVPKNPDIAKYFIAENVHIYMKRRDMPANQTKYHTLDPRLTIKENLQGKTVIEYPQFIVALRGKTEEYDVNCYEGQPPSDDFLKSMKQYTGEEEGEQNDGPPSKAPTATSYSTESAPAAKVCSEAKKRHIVKEKVDVKNEPANKKATVLPSAESVLKNCQIKGEIYDPDDFESFP